VPRGVKGHKQNEISFAHILLATACPGSPSLWERSFTPFLDRRNKENNDDH